MAYQTKIPAAVLNAVRVQTSATERRFRFDRVEAIYGIAETLGIAAAAFLAALIYWQTSYGWVPPFWKLLAPSILISVLVGTITVFGDRIRQVLVPGPAFLSSAIRTSLESFSVLIALFFILKVSDDYSRGVVITQFFVVTAVLLAVRTGFQTFVRSALEQGRLLTDNIVVIGSVANDRTFLNCLTRGGARVVSALPLDGSGALVGNRNLATFIRELVDQCRQQAVGTVVIAPSRENNVAAARIVDALAETPVTVHVVPFAENRTAARRITYGIGGLPTAMISNQPLSSIDLSLKRGVDIAVSLFALLLLAPLFLAIAIAISLDSPGPIFFRQARHGYGNSAIRVLKFRTMHVLEDGQAFRQATRNDPRITKVGRFLRRTNLDELPQLYNVLFGEMSIVGPRPHPIALNESFADRIKWFNRRHTIRPGITGWAQVNGYRGETETIEKMAGRVEHDLWYLDNWSFLLDCKIMLLTVFSPLAYRAAR